MKKNLLILAFIFIFLSSGCVYYTFHSGSISNVRTVSIKPVKNNTLQYGLESIVESTIRSDFVNDGRLSLKNGEGDISVTVTVNNFSKIPYDYDASGNVKSYKVSLNTTVLIKEKALEKPLFSGNMSDWVSENASDFDLEKAKEDISKKISDDIIEKIFSSW